LLAKPILTFAIEMLTIFHLYKLNSKKVFTSNEYSFPVLH